MIVDIVYFKPQFGIMICGNTYVQEKVIFIHSNVSYLNIIFKNSLWT